jgi:hypothetical protein
MLRRLAAVSLFFPVAVGAAAGLGTAVPGWAQDANPIALVQQIHDQAYGRCMKDGRMGLPGAELQANCSCAADVAVSLLSDDAKQAMSDGTMASFKGPMLKGDELSRNVALLRTCPKVGEYLHQQYCGKDANNPHCVNLEKAQQLAQ